MPAVSVVRPGTALTSNSVTGTIITADIGDTTNTKFYIKTTAANFNFSVPVVESTGSGDSRVRFEHATHMYCSFSLQGVMLAGKAIGLANLNDQIDYAETGARTDRVTLDFEFGGPTTGTDTADLHKFTNVPCVIQQIQIQWDGKAPVVGLAMAGQLMLHKDSTLTAAEDDAAIADVT